MNATGSWYAMRKMEAEEDQQTVTVQHRTYGLHNFWDADGNSWEILSNPPGGYSWMFERGDQEGIGHMSRKFERPSSTQRK